MHIVFYFPEGRQKFQTCTGTEELRKQMQKHAASQNVSTKIYRIVRRGVNKYLYAKCRHCSSFLSYVWSIDQQIFKLRMFSNKHSHEQINKKDDELNKFIRQLPLNLELATARKIATNQFHISASKFYHRYNKLKKTLTNLRELISQLQRRNYQISIDPFPLEDDSLPRIIVAISPQMKQMFRHYGQVVCYDLTYSIIQERSASNRQYAVGVFTGVNCFNKIIPFAISITCEQTTEAFAKIFHTFIQCNGEPNSFITDEQNSIKGALQKLKNDEEYQGTHLLDSFHVIRNFGKTSQRKDLMHDVSSIIKEECSHKFQVKLQQLKGKLVKQCELKAFQLFVQKMDKVCFSKLPSGSFVIFNSSNSINEKMNDLVKSRIRSQRPYNQALRILVQFTQILISSSQQTIELEDQNIEDIFQDSNLRLCRFILAKRPMQQLIRQYVRSLELNEPTLNQYDEYIFKEKYGSYSCQFSAQQQTSACTCNYTIKTGIPCRHILKVFKMLQIDYMKGINKRWKYVQRPINVKSKIYPKRSTRRRT